MSIPWTVFFAATHSNHGLFGDCYSTTTSDVATTYLSDADIQAAVASKAAGPNPQPYLFVQIHGCDGGGSTTLANDFGIPTPSSDDRAFVGFGVTIAVNQRNTNFTVTLWQYLLSGQTIDQAQYNANHRFPIQVYIDQNTKPNDNPGNTTIPVVYGDNNMTLAGEVYGWTSGPMWYR